MEESEMRIILFFFVATFVFSFNTAMNQNTAYADDCEDRCFAQQNTCMKGCGYIKDTEKQNSCVRGCLRGGTACAKRCRQKGAVEPSLDNFIRTVRPNIAELSCTPVSQSCGRL